MTEYNALLEQGFLERHLTSSQLAGLLRSLSVCTNNLLLILDWKGKILDFSSLGEKLLGWERREMAQTLLQDFAAESDDVPNLLQRAKNQGISEQELALRHAQGHMVPFRLCLSLWTDDSGTGQGLLGVASDQSTWNKFQEDLVRIDRLTEIGRMSAAIVHDLKNPLSIINQAAGWGRVVVEDAQGLTDADREELNKTLREIEEQTSRCKSITNQVLDFVRESRPERKEFSLQVLIQDTLRYLHPELKYMPLEVTTDLPPEAVTVQSDYQLLQQVVVNVLINAIHALREITDQTGQLHIALDEQNSKGRIRITDNGPGIPDQVQERIFDLFYTTKPEGKGTGLGLPICRRIMQRLGGDIWFESQVGKGTTFHISLPKQRPSRA
ncbi:MAG: ATP-binding protein [Desulfovermiculus sp.]|nr:ATP-binding protein [Desulfovermiculus sp.]